MLKLMDFVNNHFIVNNEKGIFTIDGNSITGVNNTYYPGIYVIVEYLGSRSLKKILSFTEGVLQLDTTLMSFDGEVKLIQCNPPDHFISVFEDIEASKAAGEGLIDQESQDSVSIKYNKNYFNIEVKYDLELKEYKNMFNDLQTLRF